MLPRHSHRLGDRRGQHDIPPTHSLSRAPRIPYRTIRQPKTTPSRSCASIDYTYYFRYPLVFCWKSSYCPVVHDLTESSIRRKISSSACKSMNRLRNRICCKQGERSQRRQGQGKAIEGNHSFHSPTTYTSSSLLRENAPRE